MFNYRDLGVEVQRDPYYYLLSQQDKQRSRNIPFRFLFNAAAIGGAAVYFITRHNEIHRLRRLSISLDLVFGLGWRMVIAALVADQVSRRLFVNAHKLKLHQMADYECKKAMVLLPNAKRLLPPHKKPINYIMV